MLFPQKVTVLKTRHCKYLNVAIEYIVSALLNIDETILGTFIKIREGGNELVMELRAVSSLWSLHAYFLLTQPPPPPPNPHSLLVTCTKGLTHTSSLPHRTREGIYFPPSLSHSTATAGQSWTQSTVSFSLVQFKEHGERRAEQRKQETYQPSFKKPLLVVQ